LAAGQASGMTEPGQGRGVRADRSEGAAFPRPREALPHDASDAELNFPASPVRHLLLWKTDTATEQEAAERRGPVGDVVSAR
jgi:hypothetical protein